MQIMNVTFFIYDETLQSYETRSILSFSVNFIRFLFDMLENMFFF